MRDYIEVHPLSRADPADLPTISEAKPSNDVGVICYDRGRFWVIWQESFGLCTYPLSNWYDDEVTHFIDQTGRIVALRLPHGTVCDLSEGPSFLPMSPCPWCNGIVTKKNKPWEAHAFARCSGVSTTYREIFLTQLPVEK